MSEIDPALFSALGRLNAHQPGDALTELFEILKQHFPLQLATLWQINQFADIVFPVIRYGYDPDLSDSFEYVHDFTNSLIGKVHSELINKNLPYWHTPDVSTCELFKFHQSKDRVAELKLKQLYCVPYKNFHSSPKRKCFAGILNLYVPENIVLSSDFLVFLSSRVSDLFSTDFIILKDKISEEMLNIFSTGITKENSQHLLERILKDVCLPMLRAQGATIYEWDSHQFGYRVSATTGIKKETAPVEPVTPALVSYVADQIKPLLLTDLLSPQEVSKQTGEAIVANDLRINVEETKSLPKSALLIPILNPAWTEQSKPIAILKLVNKNPYLGDIAGSFDYEDVLLAEEVGRILALYEEQLRLAKSREAFALLFGHEAQAPASGIRGTADRLMMKIRRQELETAQAQSLVQDIFDFSELIVSFAESLTFGFAGRGRRAAKFNPRLVNLRHPIESGKRVVIPICRYEKLQYDNIQIVGGYPEIYIDQRAVMQIFYNLFTNAIKYRRRGPNEEFKVFVRSSFRESVDIISAFFGNEFREPGPYTRASGYIIEIGDYGMGIKSEHARQIFSEGFRAPDMGQYEIRGSGVGLSVVNNIIMSFGGAAWVSQYANPTVFSLFLPVQLTDRRFVQTLQRRTL